MEISSNTIAFECLSRDPGNGYLKAFDGSGQPWLTPSIVAEVSPGSHFPGLELPYGAHVQYLDGDRQDLKGREWLIGQAGLYETEHFERTVETGKLNLGLQLILGSLPIPAGFSGVIHVKRLCVCLPDARRDAASLKAKLGNRHIIKHNHGAVVEVRWDEVKVVEEGEGAIELSKRSQILGRNEGAGLLDLGCGTAIASYVNPQGRINYAARTPYPLGVNYLASELIGKDYRFIQRFGSAPQIHLIIEGIEKGMQSLENSQDFGGSGVFWYGTMGTFDDIFKEKRSIWLRDVVTKTMATLGRFEAQISKIVIVGGGACLLKNVNNNKIALCPNPQFANVLGMVEQTPAALPMTGANLTVNAASLMNGRGNNKTRAGV